LVATILVDAVVVTECWRRLNAGDSMLMIALGLAFGELSAICIWTIFARTRSRLRWLFAYLCAALAAVLVAPPFAAPPYVDLVKVVVGFALLFWLHVSLVLACLWVAKQFRFSYAYAASDASTPWQLSMLQLLVVTTVMAVTLGLYTKTRLFEGKELALVSLWCVNNAVLAACGVMCRSIKRHIALRFAILVAVAIGSCVILHILFTALGSVSSGDMWKFIAAQIIQAIVLFIWMECVPIVPTPGASPEAINREPTSAVADVE
jgi:hypothetical protein